MENDEVNTTITSHVQSTSPLPSAIDSPNEVNPTNCPPPVKSIDLECDEKSDSKKRKSSNRSAVWVHFNEWMCPKEDIRMATCKHCDGVLRAASKNGTTCLKNHIANCKVLKLERERESGKQMKLDFSKSEASERGDNISLWKYDETVARRALSFMIVHDELPFKFVESKGFKYYSWAINNQFKVPSRKTITSDIIQLFLEEKAKMKTMLKSSTQRFSITTDTWTSIQKICYMTLTVHYVDNDWKLQKKLLCFRPITSHKGEDIGRELEKCIREWGIENIFTITVDNASSNDGAVAYLKRKMDAWKTSILGNKHVHMRCVAHIINLIVQDGLKEKEEHEAVNCIREAVRYVRSSPSRYQLFRQCVEDQCLETKKLLCLDVQTRWNSTYLMLDSACALEDAFVAFETVDDNFRKELEKEPNKGVPTAEHWRRARMLLKFLGHFYDLTTAVSGSSYVTCNTVFHEINSVETILNEWSVDDESEFARMAIRMKKKYDKYWGKIENMNKIIYYAVILDPRAKLEFLEFSFEKLYADDPQKCNKMKRIVKEGMIDMFNEYKRLYGDASTKPSMSSSSSTLYASKIANKDGKRTRNLIWDEYKKQKLETTGDQVKTELEKYLAEDAENVKEDDTFDILVWWSQNSGVGRFPILAKIARDVLGVPVSTVASESAFSTGGRVLDPYRSTLLHKTVETLLCLQDWIRDPDWSLFSDMNNHDIHRLEKDVSKLSIGASTSSSITDGL